MNKFVNEDKKYLSNLAIELGLSNKTFLISGATGMIGKILVDVLLEITKPSNIYVMGIDINECDKVFRGKGLNYSSFNSLLSIDKKIDYIFHLASPTNSKFLAGNPVEVIDFVYTSTKKMLDFAKNKNSSLLFISSMEVFGEICDEKKRGENELGYISLEATRSSYPETKRLCELLVKSFSQEYGTKCYSARLAQTFGAGTPIDDSRVFGYFARCVKDKQDIILNTTGETFGNYSYISDTISAFFFILTKGKNGECYNVVGDNTRSTIFNVAQLVAKEIAHNEISVKIETNNNSIYPMPTKLNMDNSKLKSLGWKPSFSLLDMFIRMID